MITTGMFGFFSVRISRKKKRIKNKNGMSFSKKNFKIVMYKLKNKNLKSHAKEHQF